MTQLFGDALANSLNEALVSTIRALAVVLVGAVVVLFLVLLAVIGLWDEAHAPEDKQHDETETTEDAGCAMRLESALGAPLPPSVVAAALIDDWRNRQSGREAQ